MHGIFVPLPYSRNFFSIHGNTSKAGYDSMSFFAVYACSLMLFSSTISTIVVKERAEKKCGFTDFSTRLERIILSLFYC
jgi:hypothetical protein